MKKQWKTPKLVVLVKGLPGEIALAGCQNQYPSSGRYEHSSRCYNVSGLNCDNKCSGTR